MKQSKLGLISLIALTILIVSNCSGQLTLDIDATTPSMTLILKSHQIPKLFLKLSTG